MTVGAWAGDGDDVPFAVGARWSLGGQHVSTLISETGRPARIDAVTSHRLPDDEPHAAA